MIIKYGKKIIANKVILCNSLLSSTRGLMFRSPIKEKEALVIDLKKETYVPIHTFFVLSKIDVLWLNSKKEIVETAKKIHRFTPYRAPKKKARYIVEIKAGTVKKNNLKKKYKLIFSKNSM